MRKSPASFADLPEKGRQRVLRRRIVHHGPRPSERDVVRSANILGYGIGFATPPLVGRGRQVMVVTYKGIEENARISCVDLRILQVMEASRKRKCYATDL